MTVLREIRVQGAFREPQFADLAFQHVPFDDLTGTSALERPLLDAVLSGSSAAVLGGRGGGKSSVLAWLCRNLREDHIPIRIPVVGMDDPSDASVVGSVALGAALEAARAGKVDLSDTQAERLAGARADDVTMRPAGRMLGAKLGGGSVPAEVSVELASLQTEYVRGAQPIDRLHGFDRLLGVFSHHGLIPVLVIEDTEAALGAGADEVTRDRFFTNSLRLLIREVDTPTVIAVQTHYTDLVAYAEIKPSLLEVTVPILQDRTIEALDAILARRLQFFELAARVDEIVAPEAMPMLADFYLEKEGSIRHVLAALDVAAATAVDNGDERLETGHIRLGIEDWRDR